MEESTQTSQDNQPDKITNTIKEQIIAVRDTGETNMFSINGVMRVAYDRDLFELVNFLSERKNKNVYMNFILHGDRKQEK